MVENKQNSIKQHKTNIKQPKRTKTSFLNQPKNSIIKAHPKKTNKRKKNRNKVLHPRSLGRHRRLHQMRRQGPKKDQRRAAQRRIMRRVLRLV